MSKLANWGLITITTLWNGAVDTVFKPFFKPPFLYPNN